MGSHLPFYQILNSGKKKPRLPPERRELTLPGWEAYGLRERPNPFS